MCTMHEQQEKDEEQLIMKKEINGQTCEAGGHIQNMASDVVVIQSGPFLRFREP